MTFDAKTAAQPKEAVSDVNDTPPHKGARPREPGRMVPVVLLESPRQKLSQRYQSTVRAPLNYSHSSLQNIAAPQTSGEAFVAVEDHLTAVAGGSREARAGKKSLGGIHAETIRFVGARFAVALRLDG